MAGTTGLEPAASAVTDGWSLLQERGINELGAGQTGIHRANWDSSGSFVQRFCATGFFLQFHLVLFFPMIGRGHAEDSPLIADAPVPLAVLAGDDAEFRSVSLPPVDYRPSRVPAQRQD